MFGGLRQTLYLCSCYSTSSMEMKRWKMCSQEIAERMFTSVALFWTIAVGCCFRAGADRTSLGLYALYLTSSHKLGPPKVQGIPIIRDCCFFFWCVVLLCFLHSILLFAFCCLCSGAWRLCFAFCPVVPGSSAPLDSGTLAHGPAVFWTRGVGCSFAFSR